MTDEEMTTMKISRKNREKLKLLAKGNNKSYNEIITEMLSAKGGIIIDDVITVDREPVALSLKYWETDPDNPKAMKNLRIKDITFKELRTTGGNAFMGYDYPAEDNYVNSYAEIIDRAGDDVILRVLEFSVSNGRRESVTSIVHIKLF